MNFEIFISTNRIFLKTQYIPSRYFVIWKKYFLRIPTFLKNIINVKVAKVLGYGVHHLLAMLWQAGIL